MRNPWIEKPRVNQPRWVVRYIRPDGSRGQKPANSHREAEELKETIRRSLADGRDPFPRGVRPPQPSEPGLREMVHGWLDESERANKHSTFVSHVRTVGLFTQFLEATTKRPEDALRGSDVSTQRMRDYWEWLSTPGTGALARKVPRTTGTKRRAVNSAYAFLSWASKDERFRDWVREPAMIGMPQAIRGRPWAPTWLQAQACVRAVRTPWHLRAVLLMYYTGLRVDLQVMQLQWSDIDLEARLIHIRRDELCKTVNEIEINRAIPVAPPLFTLLESWHRERTCDHLVEIPKRKVERRLRARDTKRAWVRALGEWPPGWKLPNHAFRKTLSHGLQQAGVDTEVVTYWLGQKSLYLAVNTYSSLQELHEPAMREAAKLIPPIPAGGSVPVADGPGEASVDDKPPETL